MKKEKKIKNFKKSKKLLNDSAGRIINLKLLKNEARKTIRVLASIFLFVRFV